MAFISGTSGGDNINGTSKADEIHGLAGDDTVRGGAADDRILGGVGDDRLWGGDGGDDLLGDEGNDEIFGEAGGDNLSGGDGDDALDGGAGTDSLAGGAGRDTLTGGSGSDALDGGAGVDVARFSGEQSDYRITTKPNGTTTITDQRPGASQDGVDTLENIERLYFAGDNTTVYLTPNTPPVAADDAGSALENAGVPSTGNVLGDDSDADLDPLEIAAVRTGTEAGSGTAGTVGATLAGAYGSLTLNADGSYSYVVDDANAAVDALNANQTLTDNFTYVVSDGNGGTDQATLAITITGANDAPVAADDAGAASEAGVAAGSDASGNVLTNDSDVDNGDSKSVAAVRTGTEDGSGTAGTVGAALAGAYGSLTLHADGSYSYVVDDANATVDALNGSQTLTDNFTYVVSDGNGGTDQATLAITITGANDAPVAADDAGSASEAGVAAGSDASGNVLTNDSDVDSGDGKSIAAVRTGTEPGSGTTGAVGAALAGAYGSLTLNADGTYSYVVDDANASVDALNATETLTDNFTYVVSDGNGGSDQATLAITITGANDAPVATDDAGAASEAGTAAGADASGNVLTNDSDVDNGDSKSVAAVRTGTEAGSGTTGAVGAALAGAYGSLTVNADGTYSYVVDDANASVDALNANQTLTDNFTYAVSDGNGGTDQATLAVTITGANDAPVSGGSQSVSGSEDDASIGGTVPPASDVDGDSLTYALVTGSVKIDNVTATDDAVTFNADGSYSYTPGPDDQALDNGESRSITFQYVASDGTSQSAPATVTITVDGADDNLRPAAGDDSATTDEDTPVVIDVLANDADPEGEALTPQLVDGPENGAVSYDATTRTFTYTPAADFNGTDGFTYQVSDTAGGTSSPATVAITVNPVNDRPAISSGTQAATVNELADGAAGEDATLNQRSGAITYTDPDSSQTHTASFTPQGTGYVGTFSLGAVNDASDSVEWSFEVDDSALNFLAANQTLTQNYLVLVTDSAGASASQIVTITLRGANDPVTTLALSGQIAPENVPGAVVGVLSATDPDTADTLTYSILPGADGAKFTIVGNELRVGSTALDYETAATHTVNVRVTDGGGASTDRAFKIAVQDSTEGALTQGTDTISPQVSDDQVSGNSLTLNPADSLDGGGGNDSLLLFGSGTFDLRPAGVAQFTGFEEVRLVNFTANEAGLILRGTADPLTIRGSGSGRETIFLNTAAAATVDVQTADGSDVLYGGAGTATIGTGKGSDQIFLSTGDATVDSGDDSDTIRLGTGQATVNAGAGNDTVYTHLSSSVYINNVYYGANTTGGWNGANSLDGGANFDTLYFYGSGTFDLTDNSIVNFEQLYLVGSALTLVVDNDLLSSVTSIASGAGGNRLAVTDASVDLSNKSVSNLTITSNNATGTTFTVNNAQTAFQIFGGSGAADVLNAPTLTLTSDQRGIIFATSSIESIVDSTGTYSAPAPDPAVFKLTTGSDTVPPAGVTPPDSITVNASTVTLTSGDRLDGGATGTDVLALYGAGTFDLRSSGVAELTGFEEVRLVNFTANEAGLILRGTADPVTIRGSGSGRESVWLNTLAAATVDVQTADGSDVIYGGAGTAVIGTGKGGDQVFLSSGAATVNTGAGNDAVYTNLSNSVYINNVYYGNIAGGWNAGNSLDGGANFDSLYFYGSGTFDLTANSIVNFEQLYLAGSSLTLVVDNDLLATVTSIGSNYASNRLAVTDASLDLSNKSVSNLTITSNNATGTTFTVNSAQTAFQIFGGSGSADVLNAPTLTLTSDQRAIIFATSSIESIVDSTGTYSAPAADPAVFKLTSGSDTVPPAGVTPPDSITVNASTVTLTSGDRLDGGATGTDVLALYGAGTFDLRSSGVAELTGFEEVRLVNFTASEAGLILRGTPDPLTIRGSGSGRETIWLNTAAAATVDVQTADGSDVLYGGAGTSVIDTGKGGDQVFLSTGAATVDSGDDWDTIRLGTGQATVNAGAGNDSVYTHLGNSVYINNVYYGANTTGGWNAGNSLDGGADFDTLYFYGSGTFDLTDNSIVNFEQLHLAGSALTLVVDNDLLATVTSIGSSYASNRLAVTDASVDLNNKSVSNLTITSNNATGTTFTVNSAQTAFQVIGGSGVDTIQANFAFTAEQRAAIFSGSLVEVIRDTTGSYGNAAANDIQALASGGNLDGGAGNDILRSGTGDDAITGGAGGDTFVFSVPSSGTDSIIDHVSGTDTIQVSASGFGLSAGDPILLSSGSDPSASGSGGQFLYDTDDGKLSFDSDGSGAAQPVVMVTLVGQPTLVPSDILVA